MLNNHLLKIELINQLHLQSSQKAITLEMPLQIFYEFFIAYSKTRTAEQVTEIEDEEVNYNVWHT